MDSNLPGDNQNLDHKPLPLTGNTLAQIQFSKRSQTSQNQSTNQSSGGGLPPINNNQSKSQPSSGIGQNTLPPIPKFGERLNQQRVDQNRRDAGENEEDDDSKGGINPIKLIIGFFKNIKRLGCTGCFIIILVIAIIIITVIFKPPLTWKPMKTFLNGGFEPPIVENYDKDKTVEYIDSIFSSSDGDTLILTEAQVTALIRSKLGDGEEQIVDFEPGVMRIIADGDSKRGNPPLWMIVEMQENSNNELLLSNIGFGRFGLPSSWNDNIGSFIFRSMSLARGKFDEENSIGLMEFLVTKESSVLVNINDVRFDKNQVVISYNTLR